MSTMKSILRYVLNPTSRLSKRPARPGPPDGATEPEQPARPPSRIQAKHVVRNLPLVLGVLILFGLFLVVLFGPLMSLFDPYITAQSVLPYFDNELQEMVVPPFPPSASRPLGTDQWGNDMLSLLLYGARVTLVVAIYITVLRIGVGSILGSLSGWKPESGTDRLVMGLMALVTALPLLLSGMILILVLDVQKGAIVFILALSAVGWTEIAQYVRGELMLIRQKPYVEAARATGLSELQVVVRHALPNVLPQVLVIGAFEMGAVLLLLAELAFLGVFIGGSSLFTDDPVFGSGTVQLMETPEWGVLVAQGVGSVRANPHLILAPALAFFVAILGFNALGEGLRRLLDRAAANTGILLSKRMLLFVVATVALSFVIIENTGPRQSFVRLAEEFRADLAFDLAGRPDSAPGEDPRADYVADRFKKYDVLRGWRTGFASSYLYEETMRPTLVGYLPGYDYELAHELVVVLAEYGDDAGLGLILELARVWNENALDPRRSVLFVAWGGEPFERAEVEAFLNDPENFKKLPIPSNVPVRPSVVLQLNTVAGTGRPFAAAPDSDTSLLAIVSDSASQIGLSLAPGEEAGLLEPEKAVDPDTPTLNLEWSLSIPEAGEADGAEEQLQQVQEVGKMLSLMLTKLVRLPEY
jgi:peptide/nickel transport system permease protein